MPPAPPLAIFPSSAASELLAARLERRLELRRRCGMWMLAVVPLVGIALSVYQAWRSPPTYEARGRMQMVTRGRSFTRADRISKTGLNDELALLRTAAFRSLIVQQLDPYTLARLTRSFKRKSARRPTQVAMGSVPNNVPGVKFKSVGDTMFELTCRAPDREVSAGMINAAERAAELFSLQTSTQHAERVSTVMDTRLATLAGEIATLERAQDDAGRMSDQARQDRYLTELAYSHTESARRARKILRRGRKPLSGTKQSSPDPVQEASRPDVALTLYSEAETATALTARMAQARVRLIAALDAGTRRASDGDDHAVLFDQEASADVRVQIRNLRLSLDQQRVSYAQLAATLGQANPQMQAVLAEMTSTGQALAQVQQRLGNDAGKDAAVTRVTHSAVSRLLEQRRRQLSAEFVRRVSQSADAIRLGSDLAVYNAERLLLRTRSVDTVFKAPAIEVIDRSYVPAKALDKAYGSAAAVGGLSGFAVAFTLIVLMHWYFAGSWGVATAESELAMPMVAVLPRLASANRAQTIAAVAERAQADEPYATAVNEFGSGIMAFLREQGKRTIVLTGAEPGVDTTMLAADLALRMARAGQRILLIETNLHQPMLALASGLPMGPGLGEVMGEQEGLAEAIQVSTGHARLHVLTAGRSRIPAPVVVQSDAFQRLLADARERYDCVLLLAAPLLAASEGLSLVSRADLVLVVVRHRQVRVPVLRLLRKTLARSTRPYTGLVVSGVALDWRYALSDWRFGLWHWRFGFMTRR